MAIFLKDTEGGYFLINKTYEQWYNVSSDDIKNQTADNLFPPEQVKIINTQDQSVLDGGEPVSLEYDALTKNGQIRSTMTTRFPIRDESETIIAIGGVVMDMTSRKKAEEYAQRLIAAVDASDQYVLISDADDNIVFCNNRYREANSIAEKALDPGTPFEKHLKILVENGRIPEAIGREDEWLRQRMERHYNPSGSFEVERENGCWLLVQEQHLPDGGIINVGIDITERKNLEAQLSQAQKMEAVGQLTGGIAHDFNNMMAVMMGNLEQALDRVEPNQNVYNNIETALDAVEKGAALTQQLLSFSRQQNLNPSTIDTNELIMDILRLLKRTLGENIEISTNFTDDHLPINIDGTIFSNALVNLAINARDAMPNGGTLTINTVTGDFKDLQLDPHEEPAFGKCALVTVSDSGTGIDAENIPHVFEPFFTTKEVGKGSGLGLSMVYGFVQQSSGHIGVKSTRGVGTTISIYLPITTEIDRHQNVKNQQQSLALTRKGILLVEDDPDVRETTATLLSNFGYQVFEAEDGPSALEILEEKSGDINLVISDIVMPNNLSGIELTEQITAKYKNIRVLLTSGYPDRIADMKTLGIELLAKPYRRAQLAAAVERTTARQSQ